MSAEISQDKLKLFVSYSRRDLEVADALVAALESMGFEVLIDRRDLPYGEEWQDELAYFIQTADAVLWEGWRFEVVDLDGKRVDKVLVTRTETPGEDS